MQDSSDGVSHDAEGGVKIEGEDDGKGRARARVEEAAVDMAGAKGASARDLLHFTSAKAGMSNMTRTREEIDRIIYENSKGSSYWEEQRRESLAKRETTLDRKRVQD